jgi:hypothetical protein
VYAMRQAGQLPGWVQGAIAFSESLVRSDAQAPDAQREPTAMAYLWRDIEPSRRPGRPDFGCRFRLAQRSRPDRMLVADSQ